MSEHEPGWEWPAEGSGPRVLLVDDDVHLLAAVRRGLSLRGFAVTAARTSGEAFDCIDAGWPEVVVLDIMMPGFDGLHLCRLIRDRSQVLPVLMLTALDSVPDRVAGLEAGADDYLVKPFALDELVARIRALLRRSSQPGPSTPQFQFSDLTVDSETWTTSRGGQVLTLTAKEFKLLDMFVRSPGRVFTRDEIVESVWGPDTGIESNVLDAHIANLRQKMEAGGRPRLIQTVRAVGYVLKDE